LKSSAAAASAAAAAAAASACEALRHHMRHMLYWMRQKCVGNTRNKLHDIPRVEQFVHPIFLISHASSNSCTRFF
jgi:hypothetical protein